MNTQNINLNICDIPCMILCGGKGTRLSDITESLPKPMVKIGNIPIVVHIMNWYAKFGVRKFILCLGYKKEEFIKYFKDFNLYISDMTIMTKSNKIVLHSYNDVIDWEITLVDTGENTKTSLRLKKAERYLDNNNYVYITYGDGVSNIDIAQLTNNHILSNRSLTISAVKNPSRFGTLKFNNENEICAFDEKNVSDQWINGGFMIANRSVFSTYITDDDVFFENEPIHNILMDKQLNVYKHFDFWQCMDNAKEYKLLNDLWNQNNAKWK